MNGVEILSSSQVAIKIVFSWSSFWVTLCIVFLSLLGSGLLTALTFRDKDYIAIGTIFGCLIGIVTGLISGLVCGTPMEYETQYKVTISDEVQMNSFLERYEILDQEGKIYTVKEKQ